MSDVARVVGGAVAVGLGFLTSQPWLIGIGASLVLGVASKHIARSLADRHQGIKANVRSPTGPLKVIYGTAQVGGAVADVRVDEDSPEDRALYIVLAMALGGQDGTGIAGIDEIYLNDDLAIDAGGTVQDPYGGGGEFAFHHVEAHKFSGTNAQNVATTELFRFNDSLNDIFPTAWPVTSEGAGIAGLVLRLAYNSDVFPTGIPRITANVRGAKVFDPRDSTWKHSDNPALCIRDFLTSGRYGVGADASELDEQSFKDAANYCDELVSTPDGTEKRFTCNGVVDTARPLRSTMDELLSSCRGELIYQSGTYRLHIRQPTTTETFKLDEENIIGDWSFRRAGTNSTANVIRASYVDPNKNHQVQQVTWPEPGQANGFLADDNGVLNQKNIDLPFTAGQYAAKRIAMVALKESRADVAAAVTVKEEALVLQVGDVVPVTHATPGWTDELFRVAGVGILPDATVRLALAEYDATAYTLDAQSTASAPPGTDLPNPTEVDPPTALTLTSDANTALATQQGQFVPRVKVEWTASPEAFLAYYELRYKENSASDYDYVRNPGRDATLAWIAPVTDGETYDVEIRAVAKHGGASDWVTGQVTASTQPGAVGSAVREILSETASTGTLTLEPVTGAQVTKVEFRTQVGDAGWGAWAEDASVPYSQDVALAEKHNSKIAYRVSRGPLIAQEAAVTFDIDSTAHLVGLPVVSYDGQTATVRAAGDSDCDSLWRQESTDGGSTWGTEAQFSSTRTGNFSVQANASNKRLFRVYGKNSVNAAGPSQEVEIDARGAGGGIEPPTAHAESVAEAPNGEKVRFTGSPAAGGPSDLEYRYRRIVLGTTGDWQPDDPGDGWAAFDGDATQIIARDDKHVVMVQLEVRYAAHPSLVGTGAITITPTLRGIDPDDGGVDHGETFSDGDTQISREDRDQVGYGNDGGLGSQIYVSSSQHGIDVVDANAEAGAAAGSDLDALDVGGYYSRADDQILDTENVAGRASPLVRDDSRSKGQNLLGKDAGPPHTFTGFYEYLHRAPLDVLGLFGGALVSARCVAETNGTTLAAIRLRTYDGAGTKLQEEIGPAEASSGGSYLFLEDVTLHADAVEMLLDVDNRSDDGAEVTSSKAILNVGPKALLFQEPPIRSQREDSGDLTRDRSGGPETVQEVVRQLTATGELDQGIQIDVNGKGHTPVHGVQEMLVHDGQTTDLAFDPPFAKVPLVILMGGAANRDDDPDLTKPYFPRRQAVNVTKTGIGRIVAEYYDLGTVSEKSDPFGLGTVTAEGSGNAIGCNLLNAGSSDSEYEARYHITLSATSDTGDLIQTLATVRVDTSPDGGTSWTERGSKSYSVSSNQGTESINKDDFIQFAADLDDNDDVRIWIESFTVIKGGGSGSGSVQVDPSSTTYTVNSGENVATMTPAGLAGDGKIIRLLVMGAY